MKKIIIAVVILIVVGGIGATMLVGSSKSRVEPIISPTPTSIIEETQFSSPSAAVIAEPEATPSGSVVAPNRVVTGFEDNPKSGRIDDNPGESNRRGRDRN